MADSKQRGLRHPLNSGSLLESIKVAKIELKTNSNRTRNERVFVSINDDLGQTLAVEALPAVAAVLDEHSGHGGEFFGLGLL
jgi:hypothetical protein